MSVADKYKIPENLLAYLAGWQGPPSTARLTKEVKKFAALEPAHRQQQNRTPRRPKKGKKPESSVPAEPLGPAEPLVLKPMHLLSKTQLVRLCSAAQGGGSEDKQLLMTVVVETADG